MTSKSFFSQPIGSLNQSQRSLFLLNNVKGPEPEKSDIILPIYWKQGHMEALDPIRFIQNYSIDEDFRKTYLKEILGEKYNGDTQYNLYSIQHDNSIVRIELGQKISSMFMIVIAEENEDLDYIDSSWSRYVQFQNEPANTFSFFFKMTFKSKKLFISSFDYSITVKESNTEKISFEDFEITVPGDLSMREFINILGRQIVPESNPDELTFNLYPNPIDIFITEKPIKIQYKVSEALNDRGTNFKLAVFKINPKESGNYYCQRILFTPNEIPEYIFELMLPYSITFQTSDSPDDPKRYFSYACSVPQKKIASNIGNIFQKTDQVEKTERIKSPNTIYLIRDVIESALKHLPQKDIYDSDPITIFKENSAMSIFSTTTIKIINKAEENESLNCKCINFYHFPTNLTDQKLCYIFFGVSPNQFRISPVSFPYCIFLTENIEDFKSSLRELLEDCIDSINYPIDLVYVQDLKRIDRCCYLSKPPSDQGDDDDFIESLLDRIDDDKFNQFYANTPSYDPENQLYGLLCIFIHANGNDLLELLPPISEDDPPILN